MLCLKVGISIYKVYVVIFVMSQYYSGQIWHLHLKKKMKATIYTLLGLPNLNDRGCMIEPTWCKHKFEQGSLKALLDLA